MLKLAIPAQNSHPTHRVCALLIVGAGPAGLSAALAAAPAGRSIVVLDDNPAPGGQVWRSSAAAPPPGVLQDLQHALARYPHVRISCASRVVYSLHRGACGAAQNASAMSEPAVLVAQQVFLDLAHGIARQFRH